METLSQGKKILVFGGTGYYGRNIVYNLIEMGRNVRVLSRDIKNARLILGENTEIIEGDITIKEDILKCLEGVNAIIISISAFHRKTIRKLKEIERDSVLMVLKEASKAKISRVVYISAYDNDPKLINFLNMLVGNIKLEIEEWLANSDLNWTVIGASPSIEIFFRMIRGKTMNVPGGGFNQIPSISPNDLGKIVAEAVVRDDLSNKRFRATGPKAFSFPEAAEQISLITGQKIEHRKIPLFPLRMAALITKPFNSYLWHFVKFIRLLNNFPQNIINEVPKDHSLLQETFNYKPTTIEMYAELWKDKVSKSTNKE